MLFVSIGYSNVCGDAVHLATSHGKSLSLVEVVVGHSGCSRHCLLCPTADCVSCIAQQPTSGASHTIQCLLYPRADHVCRATQLAMSAMSHSKQRLLCQRSDICAASHTCLLCHTADDVCGFKQMFSGVWHSIHCLWRHAADSVCSSTRQTASAV